MLGMAEKVTELMVQNEIVTGEDREIYVYGLNQGIILLVNILTSLLLGFVFNKSIEVLVFLAAYIPLRSYAGGYHAKTPFRCYLISISMILAVIFLTSINFWNELIIIAVTLISALVIAFLAPVEDVNKTLDETERKVYKKRTREILIFVVGVSMIFRFTHQVRWEISISSATWILVFMLVLQSLKIKCGCRANNNILPIIKKHL